MCACICRWVGEGKGGENLRPVLGCCRSYTKRLAWSAQLYCLCRMCERRSCLSRKPSLTRPGSWRRLAWHPVRRRLLVMHACAHCSKVGVFVLLTCWHVQHELVARVRPGTRGWCMSHAATNSLQFCVLCRVFACLFAGLCVSTSRDGQQQAPAGAVAAGGEAAAGAGGGEGRSPC